MPSRPPAAWRALFWLTTLASAAPLLATRYLPFTDLPEHVAAMATLAELMPGAPGPRPAYVLALGESQYLVYHAAGATLTRVLGDAVIANQLLLALAAVLWPVSLRALLRALGRDERVALFGAMLFWNRALAIGFLPFVASIPIATFAFALLVRHLDASARGADEAATPWRDAKRAALLGAMALLLFYTHVSAYVVFGAAAAAAVLALRPAPRIWLWLGAALSPSVLCAGIWWRAGGLAVAGQTEGVGRTPLAVAARAIPLWTFDIWRSHVDEVLAAAWWLAFATLLARSLRRPTSLDRRAIVIAVPFAVVALVYVASPFSVGAAGYLNVRLAPVLAFFALPWLGSAAGRLGRGALGVACVASLLSAANAAVMVRRVAREHVGDLGALLAKARPGTRLATLNFEPLSPHTQFWPYVFAGSYHRTRGGGLTAYSFAELPHWSVHYAESARPPRRPPFWTYNPCAYRYREDGAFYDYVLVQGGATPFGSDAPGPRFAPVAQSGRFTLYEKVGAADPDDDRPERGPCEQPSAPPGPPPL